MILNINKLVVSVITKPAPQLSPLCPPSDLFRKYGINVEVINPDTIQYIKNKVFDRFKLVKDKKKIIPKLNVINDGLISLEIPFQCF